MLFMLHLVLCKMYWCGDVCLSVGYCRVAGKAQRTEMILSTYPRLMDVLLMCWCCWCWPHTHGNNPCAAVEVLNLNKQAKIWPTYAWNRFLLRIHSHSLNHPCVPAVRGVAVIVVFLQSYEWWTSRRLKMGILWCIGIIPASCEDLDTTLTMQLGGLFPFSYIPYSSLIMIFIQQQLY